ncbi:PepSY domain-containing protein [Aliikangiella coralliicola]|uniref:PepSY domain-containing protein n=1 Tax=Aliikangiella coralliicola TaxID=2592383 RepID=A0A545TZW7_9GAMM|nr:PepSY domain-containing protein [Aliikangiella coralliicola]TQV82755.1 hypothetical protein FLL46_23560 [Aliikangiella coralliicola]
MNNKILVRKIHRYIALIVGLQLFFWSIGGLYFSLIPIQEIHGNHLRTPAGEFDWKSGFSAMSLEELRTLLISNRIEISKTTSVQLVPLDGELFYKVRLIDQNVIWVNAKDKFILEKMSKGEALKRAKSATQNAGEPISINWITSVEQDSEYRGKPLPVYRVVFDGEDNLHLYLDGYSGKVISLRTTKWRIFDFMWMLHVMDYETRDNFNHILLQVFAFLAVITSLSGIVLWIVSHRSRKSWRRRVLTS